MRTKITNNFLFYKSEKINMQKHWTLKTFETNKQTKKMSKIIKE